MLNFNNKKEIRQPANTPLLHSLSTHQYKIDNQNSGQKQHTPTQCLLLLSEIQDGSGYMRKFIQEKQVEEVEVTPWANVPYRISKQKMRSKSKTSTLMSSCHDDTCVYLTSSSHKTTERRQKQNKFPSAKKQSQKQLKIVNKNTQSIKNIRSAIARYNDPTENMTVISHDLNKRKIQTNPNLAYMKSHQYRKIYESCIKNKFHNLTSKSKNKNKWQNNQNHHVLEVADFSLGRCEEKLTIHQSSVSRNTMGHKNSITDSILRQNTGIVNEAHKLHSCENEPEENEVSCIKNVRQFGQITTSIQNNSTIKQQNSRQQTVFRKTQFQNILSDAQKKTSEYHRIKHKIMESIKKESIIRQSQQFDINKSKKMLGRYFKQIQEKNPKNKNKMNLSLIANPNFNMNLSCNVGKSQICDIGLDNNPLTKHLHDKYKLLLSRAK